MIYMSVILLMVAGVEHLAGAGALSSLLALLCALLFVASDSVLAVNRFKSGFRSAQAVILSTYFAAQWLIAL